MYTVAGLLPGQLVDRKAYVITRDMCKVKYQSYDGLVEFDTLSFE